METKEINVSEIQATIAESKATETAGAVAPAAPEATAQATQATLVAESVKAALEAMGFKKPEDPIVAAAAAAEADSDAELPINERPFAQVIVGKNGHVKVYVPFDIRDGMRDYSYDIGFPSSMNEFKYMSNTVQFELAKTQVSIGGLSFFRGIERVQGFLNEVDYFYDDDTEFANRLKTELPRIIEEVKAHYAKTVGNVDNLKPEDEFTYDELSVLLAQTGIKIMIQDSYADLCLSTLSAVQRVSMMSGPYLECQGTMHARNGKDIQQFKHAFYFGGYGGKKSLKELGITPVNTTELVAKFLARGKRAVAATEKSSYMAYKGDFVRRSWWGDTSFRSTGRIMVDFTAMRMMDPNYRQYFGGTQDRESYGYSAKSEEVKVDDTVLMTFSPYAYGFSFTSKAWGELLIDSISDIEFREDAYGKLVMEENQKEMITSLVETQLHGRKADIIDGKGGGCIFLLAGEPGTGKTLTAEVTAEHLKRPLYMVGVGELGTSASELEERLRQVLDIAATWNAVLLLDECDIFMEARTDSNIQRNAMVGVFLRLLEYYQGVLFLTSNRAKNIDKAFYSRISMAINFPPLTTQDRMKIWENNLALNGVSLNQEEIEFLSSEYSINGRQIKTACRNAMALAQKNDRAVDIDDLCLILDKGIDFQEAVFLSAEADDMRLTGMHHDNPDDEYSIRNTILSSAGEELGFGSKFFRAVGNFFNTLGGK